MAVKAVGLDGSLAQQSKSFATLQLTNPEAATAEAALQPASDAEARRSKE